MNELDLSALTGLGLAFAGTAVAIAVIIAATILS